MLGVSDLGTDKVKQFAYPDPKAAIYGRAAQQYLDNLGPNTVTKDKVMKIASVPQVTAYVIKGEVDAGFVKGHEGDKNVQQFLAFLQSEQAKKILMKHGIQ